MPGTNERDSVHATLLLGTTVLNCKSGVIGGGVGAVKDTLLLGVYITKQATAAVLTINGFTDSSGVSNQMFLTGSTTADTEVFLPWPLLNEFNALTFTPSVANAIWVFTRAYTGP